MKLISFKLCPYVQKIKAILEYKKIPYEIEYIDIFNKPAWFLELGPHGQVPLLVLNDDSVIFESDSISEYLEDVYADLSLYPQNNALKAYHRSWSITAKKLYNMQSDLINAKDEQEYDFNKNSLDKELSKIHVELKKLKGKFFNEGKIGMMEMSWLVFLDRADIINEFTKIDILENFEYLKKWQNDIKNTGIIEQSHADNFKNTYKNYIISTKGYLSSKITGETIKPVVKKKSIAEMLAASSNGCPIKRPE